MSETALTSDATVDVAANLAAVLARIEAAARGCGRDPAEVTLVAVSKGHEAARARAALEAGWRIFGENRVQEAHAKFPPLRADYPDLRLHLIGPIQTNKARDAVALGDVIETVDRTHLAKVLAKEMARADKRPDCFIEVNTGAEPQKSGVLPDQADAFIAECREVHKLPIVGLMCIPPIEEEPALHFALLAEIAKRNGLSGLSMGMSADFESAIRFGATHVRVGTAIFGERSAR